MTMKAVTGLLSRPVAIVGAGTQGQRLAYMVIFDLSPWLEQADLAGSGQVVAVV